MNPTKKPAFNFILLILLAIGLLANAAVGKAQTPQPTPSPQPTEPASPPLAPGSEYSQLTLSSWNYDDVSLYGPSGLAAYDLGLPLHWKMEPGGSITLFVNYLAQSRLAAVTPKAGERTAGDVLSAAVQVKLNSEIVYETALLEPGVHTLEISLPKVWPARTGERDRLEVSLHVYGPCEQVQYTSLQISKTSIVRLFYSSEALPLDLSDYPRPFFQRTFLPSSAVMALPEDAATPVVEAALAVAAGLGRRSNNRIHFRVTTDAAWDLTGPPQEHVLLFGAPEQNRVIAGLLTAAESPLALRARRLKITAARNPSPDPHSPLDITVRVTNPTAAQASGLKLFARLPAGAVQAECASPCTRQPGRVAWEVGALAAGETHIFGLRYALPGGSAEPAGVVFELLQDDEAINVAGLETDPAADLQPAAPQPAQDFFFIHNGQPVAETDGVIALLASPWQAGKALLLVTGLSDEAVRKAGHALATETAFPGMIGSVALVQAVVERPASPEADPQALEGASPQSAQDIPFAALGYEDMTVSGVGAKELLYQFDIPLSWALTEAAYIRLNYAHSPILAPAESAITLLYNGSPIASAALTPETAVSGALVGKLPPRRSKPGRANTLTARITLMLPDRCADPESGQAWLRIAADSSLHLAHYTQDRRGYLNMDDWPIPFTARPDLGDVLFALPGQPTPTEMTAAIQLASYLGAAAGGDRQRPAVALGNPDPGEPGDVHILAVGRPSRNPLLQKANSELPQPFLSSGDDLLQQIDDVIYRLPPGLDLGIVQSIPSPWNSERVFLAVTGVSDAGLLQASEFMVDPNRNWELKGHLAMLHNGKIAIAAPQELTTTGLLNAMATAAPGMQIVGTLPPEAPTAPVTPPALATGAAPEDAPLTYPERYPLLLPLVIGAGAVGIIAIGATIFRRRRREM